MDIKEEILAQMDSALRPEFDKAIDNTIEGAFKEDVKTLGFMVANSIKYQWEVMKPHLFYAYCLGVKAQEAKAQSVPEGFVLVKKVHPDAIVHNQGLGLFKECQVIYGWDGKSKDFKEALNKGFYHGVKLGAKAVLETAMIEAQEPANEL